MKNHFLISICFVFFLQISLYGEDIYPIGDFLFEDTLSFNPLHSLITTGPNGIWEIGVPSKTGMYDSYDDSAAIVTKLNDIYPVDSTDYFDIRINYFQLMWGGAVLSFWHKYDTDSLKDGGVIEISQDGGGSWKNISDSDFYVHHAYNGLYNQNDTILGGIPAFTGNSQGWKKIELYWHWLMITSTRAASVDDTFVVRFRFKSANNSIPKGGWELSHFRLKVYSIAGDVKNSKINKVTIFPNPCSDNVQVNVADFTSSCRFRLYNSNGIMVLDIPLRSNKQEINLKGLVDGVYLYSISEEKLIMRTGQLIKK